jgi:hypothetical protein
MRAGIEITVTPEDRRRWEAIARDRKAAQKHVVRAKVILASAEGCGTMEITRRSACPNPAYGAGRSLSRHPRFVFPFTPTSCSWLNAVETFFAALTKRRLRRGVFRSIVDLQAAINRSIAEHNTKPKPFVWTADPDRVLAAINRRKQALEAAH